MAYNQVDHSEHRYTAYGLPYPHCDHNCQIQRICMRIIADLRSAEMDNDELRLKYRLVEATRFVCPRGRCNRALLRLKIRLARDVQELPPAYLVVPLPPVDGVEAGFEVPAINQMNIN